MKRYIVVESPRAKKDAKRYIAYLRNVKQSEQAAQALFDDYKATKEQLTEVAGMINDFDNEEMKKRNLKRIYLRKHNYFFLYRLKEDVVEIVAMFHGLEDYERKMFDIPI